MKKFLVFTLVFLVGCVTVNQPEIIPLSSTTSLTGDQIMATQEPIITVTEEVAPANTVSPTLASTSELNWLSQDNDIAYLGFGDWGEYIYLTSLDRSSPLLITEDFNLAGPPIWSPDGRMIAFGASPLSDKNIYILEVESKQMRQITKINYDEAYFSGPQWSPDNSLISYLYRGDVLGGEIQILSIETNEIITTIAMDQSGIISYLWSPDGNSIFFMSGQDEHNNIYQYTLIDEEIKQITPASLNLKGYSISPDGDMLVFNETKAGGDGTDLYIFDLITGKKLKITDLSGYIIGHDWSPDGSKIVFMHIWPEEGKHIDLYMIDSNGENLTQITDFAGDENFPQWSGDGTKILFVYNFIEEELEAGKEELGSDGIWVYKLESGTFEFFEGTENGTFPMWRP